MDVLNLLARGATHEAMADELRVGRRTIKNHLIGILDCLDPEQRAKVADLIWSFHVTERARQNGKGFRPDPSTQ